MFSLGVNGLSNGTVCVSHVPFVCDDGGCVGSDVGGGVTLMAVGSICGASAPASPLCGRAPVRWTGVVGDGTVCWSTVFPTCTVLWVRATPCSRDVCENCVGLTRVSCRHNVNKLIAPHCKMHMHDASSVAILAQVLQLSQITTELFHLQSKCHCSVTGSLQWRGTVLRKHCWRRSSCSLQNIISLRYPRLPLSAKPIWNRRKDGPLTLRRSGSSDDAIKWQRKHQRSRQNIHH